MAWGSGLLKPFAWPFARRFVAGTTIRDAIAVVQRLKKKGLTTTIDLLGEEVRDAPSAIMASYSYIAIYRSLEATGNSANCNASLKLTQLGLAISQELCLENVTRVLEEAQRLNSFARIDMEGSAYTDATLAIYTQLREQGFQNVGVALQAYLFRTGEDMYRLLPLNPKIRLVKGAYKEPSRIAYHKERDIARNFISLTERLLVSGNYVAIATHDPKIIRSTKTFAEHNGVSKNDFEFQFLHGVRVREQMRLVEEGYGMRVYVPFGPEWFPYTMRRLREKRRYAWILASGLLEDIFRRH